MQSVSTDSFKNFFLLAKQIPPGIKVSYSVRFLPNSDTTKSVPAQKKVQELLWDEPSQDDITKKIWPCCWSPIPVHLTDQIFTHSNYSASRNSSIGSNPYSNECEDEISLKEIVRQQKEKRKRKKKKKKFSLDHATPKIVSPVKSMMNDLTEKTQHQLNRQKTGIDAETLFTKLEGLEASHVSSDYLVPPMDCSINIADLLSLTSTSTSPTSSNEIQKIAI